MKGQQAADYCWIRIRIFGQDADGCYRVEAELDDGSWHKQIMKLGDAEEEELMRRQKLSTKSYGQYLYQLLFLKPDTTGEDSPAEQNLHNVFQKAWGRAQDRQQNELRVQLWISEECSELHRFRWERLYVLLDEKWSSLSNNERTPFSRFTRLPIAEPQLNPDDRPLKVLLVVSNPDDLNSSGDDPDEVQLAEIKVEQEIRTFYEAIKNIGDIEVSVMSGRTGISDELKELLKPPKFHLISGPTTIKRIQEKFDHHVLHFLGHGVFDRVKKKPAEAKSETAGLPEQPAAEKPRERFRRATLLVLEDEDGHSVKVPDEQIVSYLAHRGSLPRLVFLSACDTTKFDERNPSPFTGLGPKLVSAGFPAVVAMQDEVPIKMARELTRKFYDNLLREGVIDLALNRSRLFSFDPDSLLDDWTIPVLFMRTPRGRLFTANREREALRGIAEALQFRESWKYGYLPLEAVMLTESQIKASWENLILPAQGRVDLHGQIQSLLENYQGKQPLQIAITGQRGTARSTAMRRLVVETAKKSLAGSSQDQIIPIYVDLQKCILTANAVPSYLTLLAQSLSEFWTGTLTEKDMDDLLRDGNLNFRIFFDHGDDLSESHRKALLKEFDDLFAEHPRHPCLITLTRGMWDWNRIHPTHVLDVQPLSRRRIIRFLFDCTELEEALRTGRGETQQSPEEAALIQLRRALEEAQLFDLAGMPWMFVQLIKQALDGDFPESRVSVLQDLIEERVRSITQRRGQQARALETLYALAYRMQMTGEPNLPIKQALELISGVRDNREYALEEMLDSLIDQDLLARAGGDAVRFFYPAYQAYCCAQYLRRQNNPRRWEEITAGLGRISHLRRWEDTLTLLAGLVDDPNDLLEKIAYATSLKDGEQVFLAARCLLEAHLNGKGDQEKSKPSYVESLVMDALVWRSDSEKEPRAFQRQRAVESLGRLRHLEVVDYLQRITMEHTRINSNGRRDFEYGGIRQTAGRALRRLLPPKNQPDNEFTEELEKICPPLKELIQKWIRGGAEEIKWLEDRMNRENDAKDDDLRRTNDALASMAAFALGDLRYDQAHGKLIDAFLKDSTPEVIRWAITDALAALDPDRVMRDAILPLITDGKLEDAEKFSERREQVIYLIGQIRHPENKAREFVEEVLTTPGMPYQQKGRAILTIGYLQPQGWEKWKTSFEDVVLCVDNCILNKEDCDTTAGLYLRTKALQALAYIGDLETLGRLRTNRRRWPLELERVFYSTSEEIIWRNNG